MPNSDLVTLKIELGILDDKLELALKYRTQHCFIASCSCFDD